MSINLRTADLRKQSLGSPGRWRLIEWGRVGKEIVTATLVSLCPGLLHEFVNEPRIIDEIPPPKPPRLLQQPVQPLQPGLLHPLGRILGSAGQDIAGRANPDHDCGRKLRRILGHEPLLFWSAKTDPEKVWSELFDPIHQVALFLFVEWSEWRRVGADDPQSRKF